MEKETNENMIYQIGEAITLEIDEVETVNYTYVQEEKSCINLIMKDGFKYNLTLEKCDKV